MLFSDIEELIKRASATPTTDEDSETEKVASKSEGDEIDALVREIDSELSQSMEKRASKVGIAKLLLAIDLLQ